MFTWVAKKTHFLTENPDFPSEKKKSDVLAFSLVETLVVMAILVVIASIAIPVYLNQKKRAYKNSATSDASNWSVQVAQIVEPYTSLGALDATDVPGTNGSITLNTTNPNQPQLVVRAPTSSTPSTLPSSPNTNTVNTTVSPGSTIAPFTTGSHVTGYLGYGSLKAWCFIVKNNNESVVATQGGLLPEATECPDPVASPNIPTLPGRPGTPTLTAAIIANSNSVTLTWAPGATTPPVSVDTWTVRYRLSTEVAGTWSSVLSFPNTTPTCTATSCTTVVSGLRYGVSYVFQVAGNNAAGQGPGSTLRTVAIPVSPPQPPDPSVAPLCNLVNFTWAPYTSTAPPPPGYVFNGGADILNVELQYRMKGTTTWITFADTTANSPKVVDATTLDNSKTYEYRMRARNVTNTNFSAYSAVKEFTLNNPGDILPPPPADPVIAGGVSWEQYQKNLWATNPSDMKDYKFTIPTPTYACANIPIKEFKIQPYADGEKYGSEIIVSNVPGGTTVFQGTGDKYFTFTTKAVPVNTALGETPWSSPSTPILTVPNVPVTSGINTWEWLDMDNNAATARFFPPSHYRQNTQFKIVTTSFIPNSATSITGVNNYGMVKNVYTGAEENTTNPTGSVNDPSLLFPNEPGSTGALPGGNTATERGTKIGGWNYYSNKSLECPVYDIGGVRRESFCQTFQLNGTTNYYYEVVARNETGESWPSSVADRRGPSQTPFKVGVRSAPEKPYKPRVASFNEASSRTNQQFGKGYVVWGFETSDITQRKYLTGHYNASTGNVVGAADAKTYRYSYQGVDRNANGDMSFTVYPAYNFFGAIQSMSNGNRFEYPCVKDMTTPAGVTIYRNPLTVSPSSTQLAGGSAALENCISNLKKGEGYEPTTDIPGWVFKEDWLSYVYPTFTVRACNVGLTYNNGSYTVNNTNTNALQCAESIPNSPTFTAAGADVGIDWSSPAVYQMRGAKKNTGVNVTLWNGTQTPGKSYVLGYDGIIQWRNAAHKASAGVPDPTCDYNSNRINCSTLLNVPSANQNELSQPRPLVSTWQFQQTKNRTVLPNGVPNIPPSRTLGTSLSFSPATNQYTMFTTTSIKDATTGGYVQGLIPLCSFATDSNPQCTLPGPWYINPVTPEVSTFYAGSYFNVFFGEPLAFYGSWEDSGVIGANDTATNNPVVLNTYGTQPNIAQAPNNTNVTVPGASGNPNSPWWWEFTRATENDTVGGLLIQYVVANAKSYPANVTGGGLPYCVKEFPLQYIQNTSGMTTLSGADNVCSGY